MTTKDTLELDRMLNQLRAIQHLLRQMKCTGTERARLKLVLDNLNTTMYRLEDLKMNLEEQEHWETIKRFQKEKHIL